MKLVTDFIVLATNRKSIVLRMSSRTGMKSGPLMTSAVYHTQILNVKEKFF